jgi:hypothetical protein
LRYALSCRFEMGGGHPPSSPNSDTVRPEL